jgi:hypothetical protein
LAANEGSVDRKTVSVHVPRRLLLVGADAARADAPNARAG